MARRVYHGIAGAQPVDGVYRVDIHDTDIDITAGEFSFDEGDLLVVFFAVKNEVAQPKLAIYITDTENEVSISNDEGHFIKQYDAEADCTDDWDAGDTVAFAYTQQGTGATYYWEMINGVHASTLVYGDTKLFDDTNFDSWIIAAPVEADKEVALTPNTLKKLYQLLSQPQDQEEEEEEERPLGLKWEPSQSVDPEIDILGNLSLGDGAAVNITYPLESTIRGLIGTSITHTGQLFNNGNGPGTTITNLEPFITRYPENDIYFSQGYGLKAVGDESQTIPRIQLKSENNNVVIGTGADSVILAKSTQINGNLVVSGTITANGNTSAPTFIENEIPLVQKYSKILKVQSFNSIKNNGKIAAHGVLLHATIDVKQNDWEPLGVIGYNINMVSGHDGTDGYYANVWECHLIRGNNPTVEYSIYNMKDKDIYVQISVDVLYRHN